MAGSCWEIMVRKEVVVRCVASGWERERPDMLARGMRGGNSILRTDSMDDVTRWMRRGLCGGES